MLGNNKLHVNQATMRRIVQEWVDREIKAKPAVDEVQYLGGNDQMFVIRLSEMVEIPPPLKMAF